MHFMKRALYQHVYEERPVTVTVAVNVFVFYIYPSFFTIIFPSVFRVCLMAFSSILWLVLYKFYKKSDLMNFVIIALIFISSFICYRNLILLEGS